MRALTRETLSETLTSWVKDALKEKRYGTGYGPVTERFKAGPATLDMKVERNVFPNLMSYTEKRRREIERRGKRPQESVRIVGVIRLGEDCEVVEVSLDAPEVAPSPASPPCTQPWEKKDDWYVTVSVTDEQVAEAVETLRTSAREAVSLIESRVEGRKGLTDDEALALGLLYTVRCYGPNAVCNIGSTVTGTMWVTEELRLRSLDGEAILRSLTERGLLTDTGRLLDVETGKSVYNNRRPEMRWMQKDVKRAYCD